MSTFQCDICKQTKSAPPDSISTGYGHDAQGRKVCFACCAIQDAETLGAEGNSRKLPLYLCEENGRPSKVTNWPGSLEIPVRHSRTGRHNTARTRTDVWFVFDGFWWHGTQYGDFTQIVHCKRTREAA